MKRRSQTQFWHIINLSNMASLLPRVIQMIMSDIIYPADLRPIHMVIKTTEFVTPQMAEIVLRSMALLQESAQLTSFNPNPEEMIEWFQWTQTATEDRTTYNDPVGYTYNNAEAGMLYTYDNGNSGQAAPELATNLSFATSAGASNESHTMRLLTGDIQNTPTMSQMTDEPSSESMLESVEGAAEMSSSEGIMPHQNLVLLLEAVGSTVAGLSSETNVVSQPMSITTDRTSDNYTTPSDARSSITPMSSYSSRFSSTPNLSVDSTNLALQQQSGWAAATPTNGCASVWPDPITAAYRAYAHESHISALTTILCGSTNILEHVETFIDYLALKASQCTGRTVKPANITVELSNPMREDGVNASSLLMDDNLVENMIRPLQKKIVGLLELMGEHLRTAAGQGPDNVQLAATRLAVGMIGPRPPNADRVREMINIVAGCVELSIIRRKHPQNASQNASHNVPQAPPTKIRGKQKAANATDGTGSSGAPIDKPKTKRTARKRAPKNTGLNDNGVASPKPTPPKMITEARKAGRGARRKTSVLDNADRGIAEPNDEHADKKVRLA